MPRGTSVGREFPRAHGCPEGNGLTSTEVSAEPVDGGFRPRRRGRLIKHRIKPSAADAEGNSRKGFFLPRGKPLTGKSVKMGCKSREGLILVHRLRGYGLTGTCLGGGGGAD